MGGEWWSGDVHEGKNILHHKKEKGDPGYQPVMIEIKNMEKTGIVGFVLDISGGFGYTTKAIIGFKEI